MGRRHQRWVIQEPPVTPAVLSVADAMAMLRDRRLVRWLKQVPGACEHDTPGGMCCAGELRLLAQADYIERDEFTMRLCLTCAERVMAAFTLMRLGSIPP